ncbi:DUF3197 domain-containing protein [Meiothermus sp. QL-1]|uniref:DUF3197 domain-containing protein n=1 Tax=Meiothermus sp. QL-1 TaxID=2058095 RepID=UPI000E0ACF47|nr:DUF3197 domain-containing protein [Meiothermus sp. QL-1]RDI96273.1 DUF3197 domain-containing protein [Meiothermus sp. QL-1]
MEIVGVRGAPQETLDALKEALRGVDFSQAVVTYITDWQDQRSQARYAVFVREGRHRVLGLDAFGPRFGAEGEAALEALTRWLLERGVSEFREAIIPPSRYAALFKLDEDELLKTLLATANPADPALFANLRGAGLKR